MGPSPPASPAAAHPLTTAPVVAEVTRSGRVESVHHGLVVAVDRHGDVLWSAGDPSALIYPRSAAKPLQAVAMVRHGLVLDGELLALACASHSGEAFHLHGVKRILTMAGRTEASLLNTADLPYDPVEREDWLAGGGRPSPLVHNCSGKHAAMVATCVVNGWDEATYLHPEHPLQRAVWATMSELSGEDVAAAGVDGCGAPAPRCSLVGLARAFAHLAGAAEGTPEGMVASGIRQFPRFVGGSRRDVTRLLDGIPGLVAKDGAEAVYAAGLGDGRAVAVKITDGGDRARAVVLAAALARLGIRAAVLEELSQMPVLGHGRPVGSVRAVPW